MKVEKFRFGQQHLQGFARINTSIAFTVLIAGMILCAAPAHAQNNAQFRYDTSITGKTVAATRGAVVNPFNPNFMGIVILNGKLVENGIRTLDSIPAGSIKSIDFFSRPPVDSVLKYGLAAKNGIMMLSTRDGRASVPWQHKPD